MIKKVLLLSFVLISALFVTNLYSDELIYKWNEEELGFKSLAMNRDGQSVICYNYKSGDFYNIGCKIYQKGFTNGKEVTLYSSNDSDIFIYIHDTAIDENGNFIVIWHNTYRNLNKADYLAQKFDKNGNKITSEININPLSDFNFYSPKVAMDLVGNFVVAWECDKGAFRNICFQLYDYSGSMIGDSVNVNTGQKGNEIEITTGMYFLVEMEMDGLGNFIIQYTDCIDLYNQNFYIKSFTRDGGEKGDVIKVIDRPSIYSIQFNIFVNFFGDFIVSWEYDFTDFDSDDACIYARIHDSNGNPISNDMKIKILDGMGFISAFDDNLNFIATGHEKKGEETNDNILAQKYDKNGQKIGSEFQINDKIENDNFNLSLEIDSAGNAIYLWEYGDTESLYSEPPPENYEVDIYADYIPSGNPKVDIYSDRIFYNPNDLINIGIKVDNLKDESIDLYAVAVINNTYYWFPTWGNYPVSTAIKPGAWERTILEIPQLSNVPKGEYLFYSAIMVQDTGEMLGIDANKFIVE